MELTIENFYHVDGPILLLGETGTGKTYEAKKIHEKSFGLKEKFVTCNVATINDDLMARELFGNVRGAFTGADLDKIGLVEHAKNGTLFIDEIGEISLSSQKKLLMLLEDGEYYPVGSTHKKKFSGKVILATNKNLKQMVKNGSFRLDLYERIAVFSFEISPLRQDEAKLNHLLRHYFSFYQEKLNKKHILFSDELKGECLEYYWPGNIRELRHCFNFIFSFANKKNDLLVLFRMWKEKEKNLILVNQDENIGENFHLISYRDAIQKFEKSFFQYVLEKFHGKINETSEKIGVSRVTLIAKAKKYGINTKLLRAKEKDIEDEKRYGI